MDKNLFPLPFFLVAASIDYSITVVALQEKNYYVVGWDLYLIAFPESDCCIADFAVCYYVLEHYLLIVLFQLL